MRFQDFPFEALRLRDWFRIVGSILGIIVCITLILEQPQREAQQQRIKESRERAAKIKHSAQIYQQEELRRKSNEQAYRKAYKNEQEARAAGTRKAWDAYYQSKVKAEALEAEQKRKLEKIRKRHEERLERQQLAIRRQQKYQEDEKRRLGRVIS